MDLEKCIEPTVVDEVVAETEWVVFRGSKIHGVGGYARKIIPRGTYIIEYTGEKIDKEEAARRCEANNPFIFDYDEEYDLDGSVESNIARYINHSCEPNCETVEDEKEIWIAADRDIDAGEELTFNYNFDLSEYKDYPCRCGSKRCVGYIVAEEYFAQVRRKERVRKTVRKRSAA